MKIGIDIDGVLTDVFKFQIEEGTKYCQKVKKGALIHPDVYDSAEMFGWDEETDLNFWRDNIFDYAKNNPVIPGASENIKKLKEDGHEIFIITARWLTAKDAKVYVEQNAEKVGERMRKIVKMWLAENDIIYDHIIFSGDDKEKSILENHIDVMIEDSPANLTQLSKITKMICMDWPYNRNIQNDSIKRCYHWDEIYQTISEWVKNKIYDNIMKRELEKNRGKYEK